MSNLTAKVPSMPYCLCHRKTVNSCMKEKREKRKIAYELDMYYLSESLQRAMIVCDIPKEKALNSQKAIVRAFTHFDEIRYRVDRVPHKRLCKEDLIHDLGVQANMNRIEAQVTYSIVKRAFRAYFYGSSIHGRRMQDTVSGMHHRAECLWAHAAKRTAQVLSAYYGLMFSEQKQYEERLMCVYKSLHDRLKANEIFDDEMVCTCKQAEKESRLSDTSQATGHVEVLFAVHEHKSIELTVTKGFQIHMSSHSWRPRQSELTCGGQDTDSIEEVRPEVEKEQTEPRKYCQCKPLSCSNIFEPEPPFISFECSQGPIKCHWLPMSEEDRVPPCKPEPPPDVCPPCKDSDATPCDSECECICEFCECEQFGMAMEEEGGENGKLTDTQIEDHDTDFTFVAPLPDPSSEMLYKASDKTDVEVKAVEQVLKKVAKKQKSDKIVCECVCKYKLGFLDPEDINYVAPLNDNPTDREEEEGEEEAELKPRKPILVIDLPPIEVPTDPITPPSGIQQRTAQCWMDPKFKVESSSISALSVSEPPLPPGLKPAGCRAMAEQMRLIEKLRAEQPPPPPRSANTEPVTLAVALSKDPRLTKAPEPIKAEAPPKPQKRPASNSRLAKNLKSLTTPRITVASQQRTSKTAAPTKLQATISSNPRVPKTAPPPMTINVTTVTQHVPSNTAAPPQPQAAPTQKSPPPASKANPTPPAKPQAPTAPANTRQPNAEPTLTKEDILDIIGLK